MLTIDAFNTCPKKKKVFFYVKTNKCQCSCRATENDVGTIDVQVTYDADVPTAVCKANVRLVQANCRTEVRCVPSANSSLNKIVCDTYDSQLKR